MGLGLKVVEGVGATRVLGLAWKVLAGHVSRIIEVGVIPDFITSVLEAH